MASLLRGGGIRVEAWN